MCFGIFIYFCNVKTWDFSHHICFNMINRELIRTKIVQLTYAYYQNGNHNIETAEKELLFSLSKAYHLYNYLLLLIVAVSREAKRFYDVEVAKVKREGGEMPSSKFVENKFAIQLEENSNLREFVEARKQTWDDDVEFVRGLFVQMSQSEIYQEYMSCDDSSYEADREVWRKLYKTFIVENDSLDALLEEKSLYWNDDKEIVDTFVLKTIKRFDPSMKSKQELLPEYKDEEDKDFARKLFRATLLNADTYQRYMGETSRNWDFSRLAYMDIVIMQIAIAEMMTFPNIPLNVTINEYVELSKTYSTPKSYAYINGMLDAISRHLVNTGKLFKPISEIHTKTNSSQQAEAGETQAKEAENY